MEWVVYLANSTLAKYLLRPDSPSSLVVNGERNERQKANYIIVTRINRNVRNKKTSFTSILLLHCSYALPNNLNTPLEQLTILLPCQSGPRIPYCRPSWDTIPIAPARAGSPPRGPLMISRASHPPKRCVR